MATARHDVDDDPNALLQRYRTWFAAQPPVSLWMYDQITEAVRLLGSVRHVVPGSSLTVTARSLIVIRFTHEFC